VKAQKRRKRKLTPSQALASAGEGVESRRRAPTAYKATVKACSRPRTRRICPGAAKA